MITEPEVTIRPLRLDDAAAVQRYASDERVARTTTIPQPYPSDGGETFVKQAVEAHANGEEFYFGILADGELIGALDLRSIDREKRSLECGYAIAASQVGQGNYYRGPVTRTPLRILRTRNGCRSIELSDAESRIGTCA